MTGKHLVAGAAALHLALATMVPVREAQSPVTGRGPWDLYLCAACAVTGAGALAMGGLEAAALTMAIGGSNAVGLVTATAACIRVCASAYHELAE